MEIKMPPLSSPAHYTADVEFQNPIRQVRGFIMRNYNKGMHSQGFYEINIVLAGEAMHFIGKSHFKVGVGDTFIIPPDVMHGYVGGSGFDVYHILISPKYLEKHGAELQLMPAFSSLFRIDPLVRENTSARLYFRLNNSEIEDLLPRLDYLAESTLAQDTAHAIMANHEALSVIALLCEIYENHRGSEGLKDNEDEVFLQSIAYIYTHYNEKITLDNLIKMAKMSRTAYIEKFKRVTGKPPAGFVRSYRIQMAKHLLSESNLSESEIAAAVGLTDTSHLIKLFTAEMGITPSLYRRQQAENKK